MLNSTLRKLATQEHLLRELVEAFESNLTALHLMLNLNLMLMGVKVVQAVSLLFANSHLNEIIVFQRFKLYRSKQRSHKTKSTEIEFQDMHLFSCKSLSHTFNITEVPSV